MLWDYEKFYSLSEADFERLRPVPFDQLQPESPEEIAKIENFLELKPGVLDPEKFRTSKISCPTCLRQLGFFDIIVDGTVSGHHPKSFIVHTIFGRKLFRLPPLDKLTCTNCGTVINLTSSEDQKVPLMTYECPSYGCCGSPFPR